MTSPVIPLIEQAIQARAGLFDAEHETAFRLFNGFTEGYPDLALDIYGSTLVIHNYADEPTQTPVRKIITYLRASLKWLRAGILKIRNGETQSEKKGILVFGDKPDTQIKEHGVWYAINLTLNRDASFYLDTQNLRKWLIENMQGRSVLNTFAYSGSLGVAAQAGKASQVVNTDANRIFLQLATESYSLNNFPFENKDFIAQDFFPVIARFKNAKQYFDCVILDPPFFSTTSKGRVDQVHESARLINKVRPLINDGGRLIAINNALYVSGKEYMQTLENLCKDGYLGIRQLIPVPDCLVGYNQISKPITDPAPFNHSTKIAILDVRRK